MASKYVRNYLCGGLETTPIVLDRLLRGVTTEQLDWKSDSERFTLREAIAHIAEWEGIWLQRMQLIQKLDNPVLVGYDEGQLSDDHDYAHTDFDEQLTKFRNGREALITFLKALPDDGWAREGVREGLGPASTFDLAVLVLGHDGYHLRQVTEYLNQQAA